jgi:hypothetical protein
VGDGVDQLGDVGSVDHEGHARLGPAAAERAAAGVDVLGDGDPGQHQLGLGRLRIAGALAHGVDVDDATLVEPGRREAVDLDDNPASVDRTGIAERGHREQLVLADRSAQHHPLERLVGRDVAPRCLVQSHRPSHQIAGGKRGVGAEVAGHRPDSDSLVGLGEDLGPDHHGHQHEQQADQQPRVEPAGPGQTRDARGRQVGHGSP